MCDIPRTSNFIGFETTVLMNPRNGALAFNIARLLASPSVGIVGDAGIVGIFTLQPPPGPVGGARELLRYVWPSSR